MKWMTPFISSEKMRVSISPSSSSPSPRNSRSRAKKNLPVLKRAMTRINARWSSGVWRTKTRWQSFRQIWMLGSEAQWINCAFFWAKDKKSTWCRSCEESSKRESDIMVGGRILASGEKIDEQTRAIIAQILFAL